MKNLLPHKTSEISVPLPLGGAGHTYRVIAGNGLGSRSPASAGPASYWLETDAIRKMILEAACDFLQDCIGIV